MLTFKPRDSIWLYRSEIAHGMFLGKIDPDSTLMECRSDGNTIKTIREWVLEWFPKLKEMGL